MPTDRSGAATPRLLRARGFVVAALVTATAALSSAPTASAAVACPDADESAAVAGTARASAALLCLVNHERESAGLEALTAEPRAAQAAQGHADDMAARGYFDHVAPAPAPHGTNPQDRLDATGYAWADMGENIGRGQPTPRAIITAWLASPPHCLNMMATRYTHVGFGISTAGNGPYWVQVLARPTGTPEPVGPSVTCPRTPAVPAPLGVSTGTGTGIGTGTGTGSGTGTTSTGTGTGTGMGTGMGTATGGPGRDSGGDKGTGTSTTAKPITRARASARRTRRRLVVTLVVPSSGSGKVTVVLRITQRGEASRKVRFRLARGKVYRLNVTLSSAKKGRVAVQAGTKHLAARFR